MLVYSESRDGVPRSSNIVDRLKPWGVNHWSGDVLILGACLGFQLKPRGPSDPHICIALLVEDDENWFVSSNGFSSFWCADLQKLLAQLERWLSQHAIAAKDGYGWQFAPR